MILIRSYLLGFVGSSIVSISGFAQTPAPASSPAATAKPEPSASPTTESLINSMNAADLQQAVQLLKNNYIKPDALNENELSRATLQGMLTRLGHGVMLLPPHGAGNAESASPFFGEILESHIGYLRLGALTRENLQKMDATLQGFIAKKIDALVIDLRASSSADDFATAAEYAKRFCPNGKALFSLRKANAKQDRSFTSDREPTYKGLVIALTDSETSGAAEAVAGVLRLYDKALLLGDATAGRSVEYSDLPLPSGIQLRIAIAEALLPEGRALFPDGLKPDVPVEMPLPDKHQVFQQSIDKGMAQFVYENERPHLNEAALLAGRNPDIESAEAAQRRVRSTEKPPLHDRVLQHAVDVVTSLAIYEKR